MPPRWLQRALNCMWKGKTGSYNVQDFENNASSESLASIKSLDASAQTQTEVSMATVTRLSRKQRPGPTSFEYALLREGLFVPGSMNASIPVLKICYEMESHELCSRKSVFQSYFLNLPHPHQCQWDASLLDPRVAKIVAVLYEGEPILDGLPASMWLECVEPTLPMLVSLHALKRRRSNLVVRRRGAHAHDLQGIIHGDMRTPVGPYLRRRQLEEASIARTYDVTPSESLKCVRRSPNRPRYARQSPKHHQQASV